MEATVPAGMLYSRHCSFEIERTRGDRMGQLVVAVVYVWVCVGVWYIGVRRLEVA